METQRGKAATKPVGTHSTAFPIEKSWGVQVRGGDGRDKSIHRPRLAGEGRVIR